MPAKPARRTKVSFKVQWDGHYVSGVLQVSPLSRQIGHTAARDGTDPNVTHLIPNGVSHAPLLIARPLTADRSFEDWSLLVAQPSAGAPYAKDVRIELYQRGKLTRAWMVKRAWPAKWTGPSLAAKGGGEIAMEELELNYEGIVHDGSP